MSQWKWTGTIEVEAEDEEEATDEIADILRRNLCDIFDIGTLIKLD